MHATLTVPVLLAASPVLSGLLGVAFLGCSLLLILTVLIQRPQGGGLSGAFGSGSGSGETAFGARTGDALTIATIGFFVLWLVMAVTLVFVSRPSGPMPVTAPAAQTTSPVEDLPTGQTPPPTAPPIPEVPAASPVDGDEPVQSPDGAEADGNKPEPE
ncbi:MAG TPA: preprotein translocase subunit SecG [Phycisphaerales bacterium]|nr:preprotein translocase subunit SecG [Phycisphaerales bacterium]